VKNYNQESAPELPFEFRAAAALGISIVADTLDYVAAPIFALPVIGDIADGVVMTLLYRLTRSKTAAAMNLLEFVPFIGDMIPTYTLSTIMWILRESKKRKYGSLQLVSHGQSATWQKKEYGEATIIGHTNKEPLGTRIHKAYLILTGRMR
jgi:hypothetical protein